jgi:hypothetical protein
MTIAIGFHVGDDEMLLAADRQVTQGDAKIGSGKIALWLDPDPGGINRGLLAITGAGDVHYLAALADELREPFTRPSPLTMDELEGEFSDILMQFWEKEVIPLGRFRQEDMPDAELIIAAWRESDKRMWVTQNSCLVPTRKPVAVGCGSALADSFFKAGYYPLTADTIHAQVIAAYVIFRVKQSVDGCGQDTDLEILSPGHAAAFGHAGVRELEEIFRRYGRIQARQFHQWITDDNQDDVAGLYSEAQQDIKSLVAEYQSCFFSQDLIDARRRVQRDPMYRHASPQ